MRVGRVGIARFYVAAVTLTALMLILIVYLSTFGEAIATDDEQPSGSDAEKAAQGAPEDGAPAEVADVPGFEETFTHHYADANEVRLHYVVGGEGPTVVLLHGFMETWYHWRHVMDRLASEGYRVVAPDLRGYGDSEKPEDGYDQVTVAEDIRQLLTQLDEEEVFVVGADMGAPVAYAYVAANRDETRALAYIEEPIYTAGLEEGLRLKPPSEGGSLWWWHFAQEPELSAELVAGKEEAWLNHFYERFSANPEEVKAAIPEYLRTFSGRDNVQAAFGRYRAVFDDIEATEESSQEKLEMPVLALGGELASGDTVQTDMQELAEDVQGGTVPQCGHFMAEDCPEEFSERLLQFLDENQD